MNASPKANPSFDFITDPDAEPGNAGYAPAQPWIGTYASRTPRFVLPL